MAKQINYILADDDEMFADYALQLLSKIPGLNCLGVCANPIEAREQIQLLQPDLLLLDVEMPQLTGIQLAQSLKTLPLVIFITSHDKFAVHAFELDAVDYLIKPVSFERLLRAIDKVKMLMSLKDDHNNEDQFKQSDSGFFCIKDQHLYLRYAYDDLIYAEAMGDFVNFHFQNGEKKTVLVSIKNLEQQLPSGSFIRISRSHIINRNKITSLNNRENLINIGKLSFIIGKNYTDTIKNQFSGQAIKRFL